MFRTYPIILQENHYYAYGSAIPKLSTANGGERYTYNGKELVEDFNINLHDYGARQYDPLTARWNGVDALAEKYHSTTGYGYVGGNPINAVDLDGRETLYLTPSGRFIDFSSDNLPDAIVFVEEQNYLNFFYKRAAARKIGTLHSDAVNKELRGYGINYMVDEIKSFEKAPNLKASTGEGLRYQRYSKEDIYYSNPLGLPFAENRANLYVYPNAPNVVHIGEVYSDGSFDGVWEKKEDAMYGVPAGGIRKHAIHDHPNDNYVLYGKVLGLADMGLPGPSGTGTDRGDRKTERHLPYYHLVLENSVIYFYGWHKTGDEHNPKQQTIVPVPLNIFDQK